MWLNTFEIILKKYVKKRECKIQKYDYITQFIHRVNKIFIAHFLDTENLT